MPTNPTPEWVILKDTKTCHKVKGESEKSYYINNVHGFNERHLKEHCLPCPEPLPEEWAVRVTIENATTIEQFAKKESPAIWVMPGCYVLNDNESLGYCNASTYCNREVIPFDRWYFWTLGPGKEYVENGDAKRILSEYADGFCSASAQYGKDVEKQVLENNAVVEQEQPQPDYRTLYEQAQKHIEECHTIIAQHKVADNIYNLYQQQSALLEAADKCVVALQALVDLKAMKENPADKLLYEIGKSVTWPQAKETLTYYQQLKAKQNG